MSLSRPILITGSHRSGTTWLGKSLALSQELRYVEEPFNLSINKGRPPLYLKYWFHYISENSPNYAPEAFAKAFGLKTAYLKQLASAQSLKQLYWELLHCWELWKQNRRHVRPLIKDPLAFFSAPWIHKQYQAEVIVLTRHPAAYVSSVLKMNWRHDYKHFLNQPALIRDYLKPFEEKIIFLSQNEHSAIENAVWIWNMIAHVTLVFKEQYPNWHFLCYEDLASEPLCSMEKLYNKLGLVFDQRIAQEIQKTTSEQNDVFKTEVVQHQLFRHSKALVHAWKHELDEASIARIRELTSPYSPYFYTDEDW